MLSRISFRISICLVCLLFADEIVVDLASSLGPATGKASAFLHGVRADKPAAELVDPLRIRFVRGMPSPRYGMPGIMEGSVRKRLESSGAQFSVGVYYYDRKTLVDGNTNYLPGDGGDWASWEDEVSRQVTLLRSPKPDAWLVLWNEPDTKLYWPKAKSDYFELWKRAFRAARKVAPDSVITGPTCAHFSNEWMKEFFSFCKDENVFPDVVTWHSLDRLEKNTERNADWVRSWCRDNGVKIRGIVIDEYGGKGNLSQPGPAVGYLSAMERSGLLYASRSIWTKSGILSGAATPDGRQPTGLWHLYKAYADLSGTLVRSTETDAIRSLACVSSNGSITLLLGNQGDSARAVRVSWKAASALVSRSGRWIVDSALVPDTGTESLSSLSLSVPQQVEGDPENGFNLGDISAHDAMIIRFRPGP